MPRPLKHRRGATRTRRAFTPTSLAAQPLEVRVLMSATAVIQWSMAPQIFRDPNNGNQPDLPNTPAYVNPPNGYEVLLTAAHSKGIQAKTTFSWTITSSTGQSIPLSGERPTLDLQQGAYTAQLTETGLRGNPNPVIATTTIQVKDILIVSIGDSYASGEGDPVVHGVLEPQWAYSPDPAMNLQNADAHRSTVAAPAQFALALQQKNPHEAVTFVSVAASGASIPNGILGPMTSIGDSSVQLPAQMTELQSIIGTRHIDVLTVSVGGDDVGFSSLIQDLIDNTYAGSPTLPQIQQTFNQSLAALPQHYAELAQSITALNPGQVMITGYPDLTRNQRGKPAELYGPLYIPLISKADAQFASAQLLPPLDAAVASAATTYNWTLVTGFYKDFLTHGYPSNNPWINTVTASLEAEGSRDGTLHPNATGQLDIARYLLAAYQQAQA